MSKPVKAPDEKPFRERQFFFLVFSLFVILALRRPEAWIHPQLWAEDGTVYFHDQLLFGPFGALWMIHGGYLSLLQRLIAMAVSVFPIAWTPLLYAVAAFLIDAVCFAVFYLPWFRHIISSDRLRLVFCLLVGSAVFDNEVSGTLVNIQWPILLAGILMIFRDDTLQVSARGLLAGLSFLAGLLAGLTMPLLIVTLPFCLWQLWRRRSWDAAYELGLSLSVLAQVAIFLSREHASAFHASGLIKVAISCYVRAFIVTVCGHEYALSRSSARTFIVAALAIAVWWAILWMRISARQRLVMALAIYFGLSAFLISAVGRHLEEYFAGISNLGGSRYMLLPACALFFWSCFRSLILWEQRRSGIRLLL